MTSQVAAFSKLECFVIMPFTAVFDPVFEVVKEVATSAVPGAPFQCNWLKDDRSAGRITDDIIKGLNEATFCIADVSGHNPNVMWETGYAMALGKPTILIGQSLDALPFDLRAHRVMEYSDGGLVQFKEKLGEAVRQTLSRYALKGSGASELPSGKAKEQRIITITGTMMADEAVTLRRLEHTLSPYLSESTLWLVGSVGTVDLAATRFLLQQKQRVTAVGYHRFDCAEELRRLIAEGKLKFLDASIESLPRGVTGPSQRDILFCVKSDLVILLWDGESSGTSLLKEYFQSQGVATILAFL
jgi:hypothetical protein